MKDWNKILLPLIEKYVEKKHPLDYQNLYQLVVMVVLSAQDSDANNNKIAPSLFDVIPDMEALSKSNLEFLLQYISKVRKHNAKGQWLLEIANEVKSDFNIPLTQAGLVKLKGIGRKSANVILREAGKEPEGIIVDLHVIRVAPRLGIVVETEDGNKIEKELMTVLAKENWNVGMPLSFLGREICRPKNPKCDECILNIDCEYYKNHPLG